MELPEFLGRGPDHSLTWHDLVLGDGIPQDLIEVPGLYAVYVDEALSYIGKSGNLCYRLGQLIAALCGGCRDDWNGFHVAHGWEYPTEASLRVMIFKGGDVYDREGEAIRLFRPPFNRR